MKNLVIVPTFNEIENISALIPTLMNLSGDSAGSFHVLVVDDSSPDGTAEKVLEFAQKFSGRVHLLKRQKKEGLGRAYLAGFAWGLEKDYDGLIEMDADFSHRPADLLKIIEKLQGADFVIGSRYVPGGATVNWGLFRKVISRGGSFYSRLILGYPIRDWTGGFNAWKKKTLLGMDLATIRSNGYSFQIELKYRAFRAGFKGAEVPIVFEDRRVGQSKMSFKIVLEAFYKVWLIRANSSSTFEKS
jgi:dolichol-phosphate mannosyltransferase